MNPILVSGVILFLTLSTTTINVTEQEDNRSFLSKIDLSCIRQYYSDATQYVKIILYGSMGQ